MEKDKKSSFKKIFDVSFETNTLGSLVTYVGLPLIQLTINQNKKDDYLMPGDKTTIGDFLAQILYLIENETWVVNKMEKDSGENVRNPWREEHGNDCYLKRDLRPYLNNCVLQAVLALDKENRQAFLSKYIEHSLENLTNLGDFYKEMFGDVLSESFLREDVKSPIIGVRNGLNIMGNVPINEILEYDPHFLKKLKLPDLNELRVGGKFLNGEIFSNVTEEISSLKRFLPALFPHENLDIKRKLLSISDNHERHQILNVFKHINNMGANQDKMHDFYEKYKDKCSIEWGKDFREILNDDAFSVYLNSNIVNFLTGLDESEPLLKDARDILKNKMIKKEYKDNTVIFNVSLTAIINILMLESAVPGVLKWDDFSLEKSNESIKKELVSIRNMLTHLESDINVKEFAIANKQDGKVYKLEEKIDELSRKINESLLDYYKKMLGGNFEQKIKELAQEDVSISMRTTNIRSKRGLMGMNVVFNAPLEIEHVLETILKKAPFWKENEASEKISAVLDDFVMKKYLTDNDMLAPSLSTTGIKKNKF